MRCACLPLSPHFMRPVFPWTCSFSFKLDWLASELLESACLFPGHPPPLAL